MADRKWEVGPQGFVTAAGNFMKASCHHRKSGACGGCYARLYAALDLMERQPEQAHQIAVEVSTAMRHDAGPTLELRGEECRRG